MGGGTKVVVVCRNRLLRESIARILTKKADFEIVSVQSPHSIGPDEIADEAADVLVLDSLEFLLEGSTPSRELHKLGRSLKCVLVSMDDDQSRFLSAVRFGARAYVLQDASAADVVSAIRAVAEGNVVCPTHYTRLLFDYIVARTDELPNARKHAHWGLTRREQQLIPLIGRGLSNKEIANHFNLSEQTVKNHVHRILRKVGVSDRLSVLEAYQMWTPRVGTKNEVPASGTC